jgi:multidrug efflux pump subunit AcrA (membrane-fusion protein)
MNTLLVILGFQISLGLLEVIIFQIGAIILGFSIHFFVTSRKSMKSVQKSEIPDESEITEADEWRLKYYEQIDLQKKWEEETRQEMEDKLEHQQSLSKKLAEIRNTLELKQQNEFLFKQKLEEANKELDETREQGQILSKKLAEAQTELEAKHEQEYILNKKFEETLNELSTLRSIPVHSEIQPGEYLAQLATAQMNLQDHNQRISRLLEQIELLKESERKHLDTKQINETLQMQLRDFRQALSDKESEIKQIRQQQLLIHELKERLEKAHEEYNVLQDKLQKLESHISKPHNRTFEYEELQQSYFKLTKECDEIKMKQLSMLEENQRLSRLLADTEDKLRESNFQRQQYLRKVTFLEELNHDLQELSGHHKKLESQMRRIGEIEMMLNRNSENA